MTPAPLARLLIVDDEAPQMKALCSTLDAEGYLTAGYTSATEALAALNSETFDLVLTDLMMPEMDGIRFLQSAFQIDPRLVGIVMTGHGTVDTAVNALKAGALDYILKPFKLSAILPVLARSLTTRRLRVENIHLREAVGIYKLSMAVAVAADFDSILERIADAVFQYGQACEVSILLPAAAESGELHVATARGENAGHILGRSVPWSAELEAWIDQTRELLSQPERQTGEEAGVAPGFQEMTNGISIPMLASGRLVGILNFSSRTGRAPTSGEVKGLHILASAAASALDSAMLLERLREAEQRYRRLSEGAADVVFRYEVYPERKFSYVNPAVTPLIGYSPEDHYAAPNLGSIITHPEDVPLLERILRGDYRTGSTVTMRWVHRNGSVLWIEQRLVLDRDRTGRIVAIEGIARDITERKELEEQLRHAQKMEAIGRLTAGVAHDFNNLLTVINGYSDLTLRELAPDSPSRRKIDEVKKAGEQAANLTRQLLAIGRKQVTQPRVLDINAVVESNANILRRLIGEDVELAMDLDPALGSVKSDQSQIEQVLMNLAVNARDAMPGEGKLTIRTCNGSPDGREESRSHVMVSVSDTGCGMDEETQSRIFEPFFTTKEAGRGTGLGLSIVYGIVKQNGGSIRLLSAPGQGTSFEIYLPRIEEEIAEAAGVHTHRERPERSETVVVVEDDPAVRQLACTILEETGHRVLKARNGSEAVVLCRQHPGEIGLVITDLVMPGLSGSALVERLRAVNAQIRILCTSGYADETIGRYGGLDAGIPFLQKPFTSDGFLRKVREVLDDNVNPDERCA